MNKKKRVDDVLAGKIVGNPPLSLWYHFGVQHGGGEQFARTSLDYFHHYDFDFLKVMNDYFYPPPPGMKAITNKNDLQFLERIPDLSKTTWREQFKAIEIIAADLDREAYFIDTVFDAWQSLNRNLAAENMTRLMTETPDALIAALERINDNLISYCRAVISLGAAGIFLSIPAGEEIITREQFVTFVKPFARRLLEEIAPLGPMTTLHVHGKALFFDDVIDLPAPIFNWWDRGPQGPSLSRVRERINGCVMGGIDQTLVAHRTRDFLEQHVREGLRSGGNQRFFLANGCSIDTWTFPGAIETIVRTARNPSSSLNMSNENNPPPCGLVQGRG
jgi:uroporphyrinogen decarboxylase